MRSGESLIATDENSFRKKRIQRAYTRHEKPQVWDFYSSTSLIFSSFRALVTEKKTYSATLHLPNFAKKKYEKEMKISFPQKNKRIPLLFRKRGSGVRLALQILYNSLKGRRSLPFLFISWRNPESNCSLFPLCHILARNRPNFATCHFAKNKSSKYVTVFVRRYFLSRQRPWLLAWSSTFSRENKPIVQRVFPSTGIFLPIHLLRFRHYCYFLQAPSKRKVCPLAANRRSLWVVLPERT